MESSIDSPIIAWQFARHNVPVQIARAVGLSASVWLAAQTTNISILTIPTLLLSPAPLLLRQWQTLARLTQTNTRALLPILAGSIFAYLAKRAPSINPQSSRYYLVGAILIQATIPYTLLASRSSSRELARRAATAAHDPAAITAQETSIARDQKRKTAFPADFVAHSLPQFVSTHLSPAITWPFFESGGVVAPDDVELSAHQLVDKWAWLNLGAGFLACAGAAAAAWGAACEIG